MPTRRQFPKDISGQTFGRLLALFAVDHASMPTESRGKGGARYLCRCECGKDKVVPRAYLLRGLTRSCGCLKRGISRFYKGPFERVYGDLVKHAKLRGIEVDLTLDEYRALRAEQPECHYCEALIPDNRGNNCRAPNFKYAAFIDRKDSAVGYRKENCVVCCSRCNWGKSNRFTYEEWVMIGAVIKTFKH